MQPILQPHRGQQRLRLLPRIAPRIQLVRQHHVLQRRQRRNQLVRLKHEPNPPPANFCQLVLFKITDRHAVQNHFPLRRRIQSASNPSSVLFPLPLAPMIAANCPFGITRSIPAKSPPFAPRCVSTSSALHLDHPLSSHP